MVMRVLETALRQAVVRGSLLLKQADSLSQASRKWLLVLHQRLRRGPPTLMEEWRLSRLR